MSELSVSIITPSFEQGRFIEETILSVLAQNIECLEYWVIDGGSTDETLSILERYNGRLKWLSEKDRGQADAVNKGLSRASGEIIGWLNSDDVYYPHAIARVRQFFTDHPQVDIVYGKAAQLDVSGNKCFADYVTMPWDLEALKLRCFLSQPAVFFRRRVLERYGLLDSQLHFCLDYEYWLRLGLAGAHFAYLPEVLAGARLYPETKSSRYYLKAHAEIIHMLQSSLGYVPAEWLVNYSTAKVKTEFSYQYPHPRFILVAWLSLWKATGFYHKGLAHIYIWLVVQLTMLKKFFVRISRWVNFLNCCPR